MIKLRVQGLPEEVAAFGDALDRAGMVLDRSGQYANRGRSKYVREYLEIEVPISDGEGEIRPLLAENE